MDVTWRIVGTLGLVALNGYFVACEFAAVGARLSLLEERARRSLAARLALQVKQRIDLYLAACQLGITVASLGLGAVTEPAVAAMIRPLLELVGFPDAQIHGLSIAIGLTIATALHVTVGETAPKNLAIFYPDRLLPLLAPMLVVFTYLFYPVIWLLNSASNGLLRLWGIDVGKEAHGHVPHSTEEIRAIVAEAGSRGAMGPQQSQLLASAFEFGELRVRQIMTPRTKVDFLRIDQPIREVLRVAQTAGYSRLPLVERDLDHVIGVVHLKDLLAELKLVPGKLRIVDPKNPDGNVIAIPDGKPGSAVHVIGSGHIDLRKIMRPVLYVPELIPLPRLLREFQGSRLHMAVVVDEYGVTQGLVTLEDVLEELVGQIDDEFDAVASDLERDGDGWIASGLLPLHELRNRLGVGQLAADGVDTIGGYVIQRLGRFPRVGDGVPLGPGFRVEVIEVVRRSVGKVRIEPTNADVPAESPTGI